MFRITIPRLPSPGLNPNRVSRAGNLWFAYAKAKREDGDTALLCARQSRLPKSMPWQSVAIRVHFVLPYVKSVRVRDWDNLIASCKGFWDGLVQAGVLADDNMGVVKRLAFTHEYKQGREAATIFEIEEI